MSPALQIRRTPDGRIQARRLDGLPMTDEDRAEARRLSMEVNQSAPPVDQIIDDRTVAVLIDSTLLGQPIWFALRDDWRPDEADSIPIFYASELPALRVKTLEQLRSIFNVKHIFGGGMVRQ